MTIQIDHLSFRYDEAPILEDVSFRVKAGEFIAIFGPNGGGKTTLLKLLMGFLKPQQGEIEVLGQGPIEARKSIGYVPQISHLDRQFPITVLDVVMMGCLDARASNAYLPNARERSLEALQSVDMGEFKNHAFGTLSGGQAQRVLIARALVSNPSILLLDEPTASVDVAAEETIYRILSRLKGSMTILMVTHNLQALLQKSDRFLCVYRQVTPYTSAQVCEHFAQGLYHPPLKLRPHA